MNNWTENEPEDLIYVSPLQRPSAKELMRHTFIRKAKKNSYLMDLIDRYKKWRLTRGDDSETDSGGESGGDNAGDDSDTDWNMTMKPGQWEENKTESIGYSEPVNSVRLIEEPVNGSGMVNGGGVTRDGEAGVTRDTRSPTKERPAEVTRARSPQKEISSSNLSPAKSESAIVSIAQHHNHVQMQGC